MQVAWGAHSQQHVQHDMACRAMPQTHRLHSPQKCEVMEVMNETVPT